MLIGIALTYFFGYFGRVLFNSFSIYNMVI
jgi:hypothetical protein